MASPTKEEAAEGAVSHLERDHAADRETVSWRSCGRFQALYYRSARPPGLTLTALVPWLLGMLGPCNVPRTVGAAATASTADCNAEDRRHYGGISGGGDQLGGRSTCRQVAKGGLGSKTGPAKLRSCRCPAGQGEVVCEPCMRLWFRAALRSQPYQIVCRFRSRKRLKPCTVGTSLLMQDDPRKMLCVARW